MLFALRGLHRFRFRERGNDGISIDGVFVGDVPLLATVCTGLYAAAG